MNLILFFTKGVSLYDWDKVGILCREVKLYNRLIDKNIKISFITYGDKKDLLFKSRLNGIKIYCNRWGLPKNYYNRFIHLLHFNCLRKCDLIKTNQMEGSEIALRCAQYWSKPLIGRMGYIWSEFERLKKTENKINFQYKLNIEKKVIEGAKKVVVTTAEMAERINKIHSNVPSKTIIIPNFVDTDSFKPDKSIEKDIDILFVGRIDEQKNIYSLLEALKKLQLNARIIGSGPLQESLINKYVKLKNKFIWQNNVSNSELPYYMNRSRLYILPSYYEGHPKTLLEAMSCGLPVIGANSPGINNIITHNSNGYLCETNSESLSSAIMELLGDHSLCNKLGQNAREFVVNNFSIDRIVDIELLAYKESIKR